MLICFHSFIFDVTLNKGTKDALTCSNLADTPSNSDKQYPLLLCNDALIGDRLMNQAIMKI